jgi:hypothetical protein
VADADALVKAIKLAPNKLIVIIVREHMPATRLREFRRQLWSRLEQAGWHEKGVIALVLCGDSDVKAFDIDKFDTERMDAIEMKMDALEAAVGTVFPKEVPERRPANLVDERDVRPVANYTRGLHADACTCGWCEITNARDRPDPSCPVHR